MKRVVVMMLWCVVWSCVGFSFNGQAVAGGSEFERIIIDAQSRSESCKMADINGDGQLDIVAGEKYYQAPNWTPVKMFPLETIKEYLQSFGNFAYDMDKDGDLDVITGGWHSQKISWYENSTAQMGNWSEHAIDSGLPVEYVHIVDLDGDGKTDDMVPNYGKTKSIFWYDLDADGDGIKKYNLSEEGNAHGNGVGDVNGDGRMDVLVPYGWLEAPADIRKDPWTLHKDWTLDQRVCQLWTYDVDQDGDLDLLATHGHTYDGVMWLEQKQNGTERSFVRHMIDDSWSQGHCLFLADMDGDGDPDMLTGKRVFAHNGKDAGAFDTPGIYWYELQRNGDDVVFVKHVIDYGNNGAGFQIEAVDYDKDGDLDIFTSGKRGLYLYKNLRK